MNAADPVVVDFYATWCPPCRVIAPVMEQFSKTYTKAKFYKLDVDRLPDVAQEVGITAMPTFTFFKGGEKVDVVLGANAPALEAGIKKITA